MHPLFSVFRASVSQHVSYSSLLRRPSLKSIGLLTRNKITCARLSINERKKYECVKKIYKNKEWCDPQG